MVIEHAYAKLNLSLSVLGKMPNGYHELKTIMVPIVDLYDELYFEENDTNEMILVDNDIEDNSILKAAKIFQEKYKTKGATIKLVKRIPLEAGLAGGSADSSATLRGLNRLFDLNLSLDELSTIAKELGSDNVFCLYNKASVCSVRGEELEFIDSKFSFDVLLAKPNFGLKTKDVFSYVKEYGFDEDKHQNILKSLKSEDIKLLENNIYNDLLKPAINVNNNLEEIISSIETFGSRAFMSGSGSTLFIINFNESLKNELKNNKKIEFIQKVRISNAIS